MSFRGFSKYNNYMHLDVGFKLSISLEFTYHSLYVHSWMSTYIKGVCGEMNPIVSDLIACSKFAKLLYIEQSTS